MGQEFFINSQNLENKVRQLLPSQGGAGAGFDLSASSQIIPIIDLTESAEGSNVRADIQKALSFSNVTHTQVVNTTTTIISNTGYFRLFGIFDLQGAGFTVINLTDGSSTKPLYKAFGLGGAISHVFFDFVVFLKAGDSCTVQSSTNNNLVEITTRQIADIDGNLINP